MVGLNRRLPERLDISLWQKLKKYIMFPSEMMIWQPEFKDKIFSRKTRAVKNANGQGISGKISYHEYYGT